MCKLVSGERYSKKKDGGEGVVKMSRHLKKESKRHLLYRSLFVVLGAVIAAISIELFLLPNSIIDGGIIGISLILNRLTSINFGVLVFFLNLPFLIFGYKYIGSKFVMTSLLGIVILALTESRLHTLHFEPFTSAPLLATVFGGLMLGAGVGLVIRFGGALDGTEILGIILTKKLPFSIGEFVMVFNLFIFTWASFVYGPEQAMYSIITYYIAAKTIDAVIQGLDETKAVIIISDYYEEMADMISTELGRTTTKLKGKGGYMDTEKDVIYVVVTRLEVTVLKKTLSTK